MNHHRVALKQANIESQAALKRAHADIFDLDRKLRDAEAKLTRYEEVVQDIRKVLEDDRAGRTYEPLDIIRRLIAALDQQEGK
jgi:hypothetical protein